MVLHHEKDNHSGPEWVFIVRMMFNICGLELCSPCFLVPVHCDAFQRNTILNNNRPCVRWVVAIVFKRFFCYTPLSLSLH